MPNPFTIMSTINPDIIKRQTVSVPAVNHIEGLPVLKIFFHSLLYLSLILCLTISARVFTIKVVTKRSNAARNSTR